MGSCMRPHLGLVKQGGFLRPFRIASCSIYSPIRVTRYSLCQSRSLTSSPSRQHERRTLSPLEQQRLRRPVSPHLTIYKWEYQSLASILQRFSGGFLAGSLYVFSIGYLLSHHSTLFSDTTAITTIFDIDALMAAVKTIPEWCKMPAKFALALPFTYHCFNGVKHLLWDAGFGLAHKRLFGRWAWIVAGCSVVSSLGLATM